MDSKKKTDDPTECMEVNKNSNAERIKKVRDVSELMKILEQAEKEQRDLEKEKEVGLRREKEQDSLNKQVSDLKNIFTSAIGVACFEKGKGTIGKLKRITVNTMELNASMKKKEIEFNERCKEMSNTSITLLRQKDILKDQLSLLHAPVDLLKSHDLSKRRQHLEKDITKLKTSYENMVNLDVERQQKAEWKSLEEYMDDKLKGLNLKIGTMKKNVEKVNKELTQVKTLVSNRQQEISDLKTAIKHKSTITIEESKEYQKVLENNKRLKTQLDKYLTRQDDITAETRLVLNQIEDEKRAKNTISLSTEEVGIRNSIRLLDEQYENKVLREPISDEIITELERQVWARDVCLTHMQGTSKHLKETFNEERHQLKVLKREMEHMSKKNQKILQDITSNMQERLDKPWYEC